MCSSDLIEVERTLERETRGAFKAALNGEMYEPPSSDVPGMPAGATDTIDVGEDT